ncbi:MAG: galactose mutarotase [Clostridia bacterium]|nr:galactose mutarotase [Clostridia bacterium]
MIKNKRSFIKNGNTNDVYLLSNKNGMKVEILTYGARICKIDFPDRKGKFSDCIVGCKNPEDYYEENPYFGATIGRFCNRIGGAKFTLNGIEYHLEANDGNNTLHGGTTEDFSRVVWNAEIEGDRLILSHLSPDGAGGFPGNLQVFVSFRLTEENELILEYKATTDKDTPCSLTNHAYFNLGDEDTVLNHELMINAKQLTPVDKELIAHGELMDIENTPYSFLPAKKIGKDIKMNADMLVAANGYDFNYCLDRIGRSLERFAYVYDEKSGRRMDCYTTMPGVQLYTACVTGGFVGKKTYVNHCALCLETQYFPNSPNCPQYPSSILKAGEEYHEITVYKFSIQ